MEGPSIQRFLIVRVSFEDSLKTYKILLIMENQSQVYQEKKQGEGL
jgi:hypothetical protein